MSGEENVTFLWKIENFSVLPHQTGNYLQSPFFTNQFFNETEWYLRLYPRGESNESENCVSCFIARKNNNFNPITIRFSFEIKSVDEACNIVKVTKLTEFKTIIGLPNVISLKTLYEKKNLYLPRDILTFNCKIWSSEEEVMASESKNNSKLEPTYLNNESSYLTRIQVSKRCVTWPIMKIKTLLENKSKISLSVDSSSEKSPSFKLSFLFSKDVKCEHAQIEITQTKYFLKKKRVFVKCKITIMTAREEYQHSREDSILFSLDVDEIWHFPEFIAIGNLADDKYIHFDDTLYLSFEFSFTFEGDWASHIEIPRYMQNAFKLPKASEMSSLSKKIQNLYLDKRFCDVTLDVDDRTFLAQKLVLCAQSPVFCAMFEHDMKEKNTNVVKIIDVDGETMDIMLEYLHSGILKDDLLVEEVCQLYSAADKYQISLLKQQCTLLLLSSLCLENVCEILNFADSHQDNFLMTHVCGFLKNFATESFHSPEWEKCLLQNPVLFGKVMLRVLKDYVDMRIIELAGFV